MKCITRHYKYMYVFYAVYVFICVNVFEIDTRGRMAMPNYAATMKSRH